MVKLTILFTLLTIYLMVVSAKPKKDDEDEETKSDDEPEEMDDELKDILSTSSENEDRYGKKDCSNALEITHCTDLCQVDKNCIENNNESKCELECLKMCKYLDYKKGEKCTNHMMAHISWYRDFAGADSSSSSGSADPPKKKTPRQASKNMLFPGF